MSIFSKIMRGEIPCYKIAENESCFAFLDINPKAKGHTLVIPKKEVDYLFDLEDDEYIALQKFAKKIAEAQKKAFNCKRICTAVIGYEVPHAHIHLLPSNSMADATLSGKTKTFSKEEMAEIAEQIQKYLG
ncbi:MAG: HIT family protein [Bacteroidetes bacterium]|nr:MAG: HIT family protein [Bacteroidota bacterium]TAG86112.1 MAG: HIT family protein [Bacteroidota bacterium]